MDLNRTTLLGRLTQDLELKQTPGGASVLSVSMVTNNVYTDQDGVRQETADFHNLVVWKKLAENMANYAKKGSRIYVEGALKTRSWEHTDGTKRYRTEVLVSNFILLDSKAASEGSPAAPNQAAAKPKPRQVPVEDEISIEDIPF